MRWLREWRNARKVARIMCQALRVIPETKWTIFHLHNGQVLARLTTSRAVYKATACDEVTARLMCLEEYDSGGNI